MFILKAVLPKSLTLWLRRSPHCGKLPNFVHKLFHAPKNSLDQKSPKNSFSSATLQGDQAKMGHLQMAVTAYWVNFFENILK